MKKIHILINIVFCVSFIALLWSFIIACKNLHFYIEQVKYFTELGRIHDASIIDYYVKPTIEYSVLVFFNLIAICGFPFLFVYCNPRLFRRSTWVNLSEEWAKNKQERAAARQAKAEEDKQSKIAELEKQLDELKRE